MKPSLNRIPKHIGLIIDGNRTFAKRLMVKPWKGHEWGYKKIKKLLNWCREFDIKELTLYTFSIENFDRPKKEFDYLMKLCVKAFKETKDDPEIHKNRVKIDFIGRIHMFPKEVQEAMYNLMESTKNYHKYRINFAMAYGGRTEIIDATKKISQQVKDGTLDINNINEEVFEKNIYLDSEPDLVIRTSQSRLSGFLLWQASYAEIIFLPEVLWPEFSKKHFVECLQEYDRRDRKFGK